METRRLEQFRDAVIGHYRAHKRSMPWREDISPYRIAVSEIMLQQTQVDRVVGKFSSWMKRFPDWETLAKASTKEVLGEWSGLGYNRRALYLRRIAEKVATDKEYDFLAAAKNRPQGSDMSSGSDFTQVKSLYERLRALPGIGPNTAGSILAFAYNIPFPFIETNIRSAYIHFFFPKYKKVADTKLMPLIEATLDKNNAREWYWALMDYGSFLKKSLPNPSRRSTHHIKQSKFEGSNRQLRAQIIRFIMKQSADQETLVKQFKKWSKEQIVANLKALTKEGFISLKQGSYKI